MMMAWMLAQNHDYFQVGKESPQESVVEVQLSLIHLLEKRQGVDQAHSIYRILVGVGERRQV
jgi:hypothetical protein